MEQTNDPLPLPSVVPCIRLIRHHTAILSATSKFRAQRLNLTQLGLRSKCCNAADSSIAFPPARISHRAQLDRVEHVSTCDISVDFSVIRSATNRPTATPMRWDEEGRIRYPTWNGQNTAVGGSPNYKIRRQNITESRHERQSKRDIRSMVELLSKKEPMTPMEVRVWKGWLSTRFGSLRRLEPRRQTAHLLVLIGLKFKLRGCSCLALAPGP